MKRVLYILYWSDSNFIPMKSKKFKLSNLNQATRIYIKNQSETENIRSRDIQKIFKIFSSEF